MGTSLIHTYTMPTIATVLKPTHFPGHAHLACNVVDCNINVKRHFFSQSEVKPKQTLTCSRSFSRASRRLHVFASSFDWFTGLSVPFVIDQRDYFGSGFMTL